MVNRYQKLAKVAREKKERERRKRMALGLDEEEKEKQTVDEYYEEKDLSPGIIKSWSDFGGSVRNITQNPNFGLFMNIIIVIAGLLVGIGTYNGMEVRRQSC
jgi:hypothetical protein